MILMEKHFEVCILEVLNRWKKLHNFVHPIQIKFVLNELDTKFNLFFFLQSLYAKGMSKLIE